MNESVVINGYFIVATFAPDGPEKCSGIPVCRYSVDQIENVLGRGFKLVSNAKFGHMTPTGKTQQFTLAVFQKIES